MEQGDGQDYEEPVQGEERAQNGEPHGERENLGRMGQDGDLQQNLAELEEGEAKKIIFREAGGECWRKPQE